MKVGLGIIFFSVDKTYELWLALRACVTRIELLLASYKNEVSHTSGINYQVVSIFLI